MTHSSPFPSRHAAPLKRKEESLPEKFAAEFTVQDMQKRSPKLVDAIFTRYHPHLSQQLIGWLRDRAGDYDAEGVASETLIIVYEQLGSYKSFSELDADIKKISQELYKKATSSVSANFRGYAKEKSLDAPLKSSESKNRSSYDVIADNQALDPFKFLSETESDPEDVIEQKEKERTSAYQEEKEKVFAAAETVLHERDTKIFKMRYEDEMTPKEISAALDLPQSCIRHALKSTNTKIISYIANPDQKIRKIGPIRLSEHDQSEKKRTIIHEYASGDSIEGICKKNHTSQTKMYEIFDKGGMRENLRVIREKSLRDIKNSQGILYRTPEEIKRDNPLIMRDYDDGILISDIAKKYNMRPINVSFVIYGSADAQSHHQKRKESLRIAHEKECDDIYNRDHKIAEAVLSKKLLKIFNSLYRDKLDEKEIISQLKTNGDVFYDYTQRMHKYIQRHRENPNYTITYYKSERIEKIRDSVLNDYRNGMTLKDIISKKEYTGYNLRHDDVHDILDASGIREDLDNQHILASKKIRAEKGGRLYRTPKEINDSKDAIARDYADGLPFAEIAKRNDIPSENMDSVLRTVLFRKEHLIVQRENKIRDDFYKENKKSAKAVLTAPLLSVFNLYYKDKLSNNEICKKQKLTKKDVTHAHQAMQYAIGCHKKDPSYKYNPMPTKEEAKKRQSALEAAYKSGQNMEDFAKKSDTPYPSILISLNKSPAKKELDKERVKAMDQAERERRLKIFNKNAAMIQKRIDDPKTVQAFTLYFQNCMDRKEIAEKLEISPSGLNLKTKRIQQEFGDKEIYEDPMKTRERMVLNRGYFREIDQKP